MDAVVPAAGEGTRLRPLTVDEPKGLVEVAGRPILDYCFDGLLDLGIERLIVVVGYEGQRIVDHYGDRYGDVSIEYAWQHERMGMAHALLAAREHVSGDFVVQDGDSITCGSIERLVELQSREGVDGTLLLQEVTAEKAREKAICELNDDGELVRIINKPENPPDPSYVAASCHTFSPAIFEACEATERSPRGEYELAEAIERFVAEHTVRGVINDGWNANVNTPAERAAVERRLREPQPFCPKHPSEYL